MANLPSFLLSGRRSDLDMPWCGDDVHDEAGGNPNVIADWQLYHYLSDVGIHAYSSTTKRATVFRRQNRFLVLCACLAVLWVVFLFV